jgi:hypothetical protein
VLVSMPTVSRLQLSDPHGIAGEEALELLVRDPLAFLLALDALDGGQDQILLRHRINPHAVITT